MKLARSLNLEWRYLSAALLASGLLALLTTAGLAAAPDGAPVADPTITHCRQGAVVCVSQDAALAGLAMLEQGGNAIDAAVATAFALAVTFPEAGNIGGGGYLLHVPAQGEARVFDFREVAPAAATREMFVESANRTPHRRVGVPGTVRGLALAHQRAGRLKWQVLVAPAIRLAREGFALDSAVATGLNEVLAESDKQQFAALHRTFGHPVGRTWQVGDRLVQPELANVLERIAASGADGFHTGPVAEMIAAEMRRGQGIVTVADLQAYQPIERGALHGQYRDFEIVAVPPSSSGGTALIEALNILENFNLAAKGRWSPDTLHLLIESGKRAFRDRAAYLGDPAVNTIPAKLLDKAYAKQLAATIDLKRATPSVELASDITIAPESTHTTHLSVVDRDRNAVSLTYTLENSWGSRVVVPGGGFLLNDEMNDFNWLPGVTNRQGRIGTAANQIAPGKRMLSSMCPVVLKREGRTLLVTGSPGGRTIISTVLDVVVNVVDFRMDVRSAVDAPRMHQGWLPDRVAFEAVLGRDQPSVIEVLKERGHAMIQLEGPQGDAHSIWIDLKSLDRPITAAADRRRSGYAAGY